MQDGEDQRHSLLRPMESVPAETCIEEMGFSIQERHEYVIWELDLARNIATKAVDERKN